MSDKKDHKGIAVEVDNYTSATSALFDALKAALEYSSAMKQLDELETELRSEILDAKRELTQSKTFDTSKLESLATSFIREIDDLRKIVNQNPDTYGVNEASGIVKEGLSKLIRGVRETNKRNSRLTHGLDSDAVLGTIDKIIVLIPHISEATGTNLSEESAKYEIVEKVSDLSLTISDLKIALKESDTTDADLSTIAGSLNLDQILESVEKIEKSISRRFSDRFAVGPSDPNLVDEVTGGRLKQFKEEVTTLAEALSSLQSSAGSFGTLEGTISLTEGDVSRHKPAGGPPEVDPRKLFPGGHVPLGQQS